MSSNKLEKIYQFNYFIILKEKKGYLKFGREEKYDCQIKNWEGYLHRQKMIEEMIIDIDDKL